MKDNLNTCSYKTKVIIEIWVSKTLVQHIGYIYIGVHYCQCSLLCVGVGGWVCVCVGGGGQQVRLSQNWCHILNGRTVHVHMYLLVSLSAERQSTCIWSYEVHCCIKSQYTQISR